jgi:WD40 repeat protein
MCRAVISRHTDAVTSCSWFPDNNRFVTSSLDKTIYLWVRLLLLLIIILATLKFNYHLLQDKNGSLLYRWLGARVTDLAISHDGQKMIAVCHEKKIRIYDVEQHSETCIQEDNSITSLCLSSDSRYALINVSAQEIHLWDLLEKRLVHKYTGQKQGRFVIRSSFGGANQSFIVSGSEDSNVYIWNRERAKLIEVLHGHTGTVNSVAWNPRNPSMFASASDDCTIRIWGKSSHEKQE